MVSRIVYVLLLTAAIAPTGRAQTQPISVEDRVRKMSASLGSATMLGFDADVVLDEKSTDGKMIEFNRHLSIVIRRPGEMKAVVMGDRENYTLFIDGQKFLIFDPARKLFATFPVPDTLDAALPLLNQTKGFSTPLTNFLLSNPYGTFIASAQSSEQIGASKIGDALCDHLAIHQADTDVQLWLEQNEASLPRKLVINYKKMPVGTQQMTATFTKWNLNPVVTDDTFKFAVPTDAVEKSLEEVRLPPVPSTAAKP